jgi:choline dehydrogenase-like flavoprotein
MGRVQLPTWLAEDGEPEWISGSHHHMGTTRMADSPRNGVVNKNCRVHGVENLYVAGSSVFPTSGFVNPTLTIVALALRLADHLSMKWNRTDLGSGPVSG